MNVCTTVCGHGNSQSGNGVRCVVDTVPHFPNSRRQNWFGQASKTTDVLLECDTQVAKKFPVAVNVFGADLAQVLANGQQRGTTWLLKHDRPVQYNPKIGVKWFFLLNCLAIFREVAPYNFIYMVFGRIFWNSTQLLSWWGVSLKMKISPSQEWSWLTRKSWRKFRWNALSARVLNFLVIQSCTGWHFYSWNRLMVRSHICLRCEIRDFHVCGEMVLRWNIKRWLVSLLWPSLLSISLVISEGLQKVWTRTL